MRKVSTPCGQSVRNVGFGCRVAGDVERAWVTGSSRRAVASALNAGLHRIAFFIVPSVMAMMAFGDVMTGALYQTGRFNRADSKYVWGILAGSTVGLLASTLGRLYASTYYALHDTRTPLASQL
jgi:putative peptidoglycan lipid II flippase